MSNRNALDKAFITASYFGFYSIDTPKIQKEDIENTKDCLRHPHFDASEKSAFIRKYIEDGLLSRPHPLGLIYKRSGGRNRTYSLHSIDFPAGVGEALLIRTALSILKDSGHNDMVVDINCVGDKDSISSYEKELTNFMKKHGENLPQNTKDKMRDDIFNIFRLSEEEESLITEERPSPISFLSAPSRNYFKEVLEYIEALGVEFRIEPKLVGDRQHSSHAIFSIRESKKESEPIATGYAYSRLAKRLGLKKDLHMLGVNVFSKSGDTKKIDKAPTEPKVHLVQLGRVAKMRSIPLLETLRMHKIPVYHLLGKDKIGTQMPSENSRSITHLIILGQREALENAVTVRDMETRAQETISIDTLPTYLKKVCKVCK